MNTNGQNRLDWSNWPPSEKTFFDALDAEAPSAAANPPDVTLLSPLEILAKLRGLVTDYETRGREVLNRNPLESLVGLVTAGAAVYYAAERGRNDKVKTYWDALEFVATCASVGYSNIFPNTPAGKIVASVLFLLGPNLSARALDPLPAAAAASAVPPAAGPSDPALLAKLDELLGELRKLNAPSG